MRVPTEISFEFPNPRIACRHAMHICRRESGAHNYN
jgi:hypothetical protein